jgi:osmotically inducible protein OsmC
MAIRTADAEWSGNLAQGKGRVRFGAGAYLGTYDFHSRMGDGTGANPEELLGAAHAGCFSMALALELSKAGANVERIHTNAKVHFDELDGRWSIHRIDLETEASVSGVSSAAFEEHAQNAKKNCPVSRALTGVDIQLQAKLL